MCKSRLSRFLPFARCTLTTTLILCFSATTLAATRDDLWMYGGHDTHNTRHASQETLLHAGNVSRLAPKWVFIAPGDIVTTPTVDDAAVYFPDSAGNLTKLRRDTGDVIWTRVIASYTGASASPAGLRLFSSPALSSDRLVIGTRDSFILAINKNTGELIWKTKVDEHAAAHIKMAPIIDEQNGRIYVGVASDEETIASTSPGYVCCTFRGSAVALDLSTGKVLWRTYSVPEGYSGGAIWGSTPALDLKRGSVYFSTGNNYSVPATAAACAASAGNDSRALSRCTAPNDYFDSVLALDIHTGSIKWGKKLQDYDTWILVCLVPGVCPPPESPDYDFGSGPNLFTVNVPGQPSRELVGAGQKSGIYWALDPDSGSVVWATPAGPGGISGGIQWGSATDGTRVYIAISNSGSKAYRFQSGAITIHGFYTALDAATGRILWQTSDPVPGTRPTGMVSVANGVMYVGSADLLGTYYALDAKTGAILWRFPSGGTVTSGAAIVEGTVYWGSGYFPRGTGSNKVYAFGLQ